MEGEREREGWREGEREGEKEGERGREGGRGGEGKKAGRGERERKEWVELGKERRYVEIRRERKFYNLLLDRCSHGGKILNYKIVDNGGLEFYITPRRKFPNIHTLLETYKTTPIKSKKGATLLLHPIPVDVSVEQKHRQRLELRGKCAFWSFGVRQLKLFRFKLLFTHNTSMSLMGMKFSNFATFVFSVPWFRGSARSCHISFHSMKY